MQDSSTASTTILQFRQDIQGAPSRAVPRGDRGDAFGQIVLRRIDGHEQLAAFLAKEWSQAA